MSFSKRANDLEHARHADVAKRDGREGASAKGRHAQEAAFKQDNAEAFASMNRWVEENGLLLEKHRQF